jgi:hypothetical protein
MRLDQRRELKAGVRSGHSPDKPTSPVAPGYAIGSIGRMSKNVCANAAAVSQS